MDERGQGFEKAADLVKKLVERAVLHPFRAMHGPVLQHAASVCNSVATCGNCGNMWQIVSHIDWDGSPDTAKVRAGEIPPDKYFIPWGMKKTGYDRDHLPIHG